MIKGSKSSRNSINRWVGFKPRTKVYCPTIFSFSQVSKTKPLYSRSLLSTKRCNLFFKLYELLSAYYIMEFSFYKRI